MGSCEYVHKISSWITHLSLIVTSLLYRVSGKTEIISFQISTSTKSFHNSLINHIDQLIRLPDISLVIIMTFAHFFNLSISSAFFMPSGNFPSVSP